MSADSDRQWWEQTWTEREDVLWAAFGPSHPTNAPPGYVNSFDFSQVPRPGACAYTFRPCEGGVDSGRESRRTWLYVSHGLAQWLTRAEMVAARERGSRASGSGVEFGLLFDSPADWTPGLLSWIMKYVHAERMINPGDRVPFWFESLTPGNVQYWVGAGPGKEDPMPADPTRALVFWRYLSPYGTFTTSTGSFEVRIATTITGQEWELAKQTSSCHLLLLLNWAGIGQKSIPGRTSVTDRPGWAEAWERIKDVPFEDAKEQLRRLWHKEPKGETGSD